MPKLRRRLLRIFDKVSKMSINDITGDKLQTKASSESYRTNYDAIFRKKVIPEGKLDEKTSIISAVESESNEYADNCADQR